MVRNNAAARHRRFAVNVQQRIFRNGAFHALVGHADLLRMGLQRNRCNQPEAATEMYQTFRHCVRYESLC